MDESDEGLIRFLMRERHGTPVRAQLVSLPHPLRRSSSRASGSGTGSARFNEFSMRYAKATDEFYVPDAGGRSDPGRQAGRVHRSSRSRRRSPRRRATSCRAVYDAAYETYERLVELGVARELARCVLPVGAYTEFYWTVNARALMNFLSLRAAETAAARDQPLRRGVRGTSSREQHAGHVRGVRRERPNRALAQVGADHGTASWSLLVTSARSRARRSRRVVRDREVQRRRAGLRTLKLPQTTTGLAVASSCRACSSSRAGSFFSPSTVSEHRRVAVRRRARRSWIDRLGAWCVRGRRPCGIDSNGRCSCACSRSR